jgi:HK97 family phage major capsid protein
MENLNKVNEDLKGSVMDEVKSLISQVQDKDKELNSLKETNAEYATLKSEVSRKSEIITDLMESVQKHEAKHKELEDSLKSVELAMKNSSNASGKDKNEVVSRYKAAIREYARKRDYKIDEALIKEYNEYVVNQFAAHEKDEIKSSLVKTLSVDSNPDGGYLVFPERNPNVQDIREFETSPVRSVANVVTTAAESYEIVIDDDESASGGWVSEQEGRGETNTSQFGKITIPTHEQYAQPKVTQKLIDDISINIESYLNAKTQDIVTRTENTAFVSGDGSGKPKGFLSYDAWAAAGVYERGKIEQIKSTSNGAFVADTIKELKNSLKGAYQGRAIFGMKRDGWQNIITLKDGQNNYLLDPRSFKDGDTEILLGKRVIFMDDMPGAATDSLSMVYGDFNAGYTIVDRVGFRVLRDPYTDKPYIKFYTTKRVGGAVTNYEALKIYKLAA